jgi:hypothetical protein
MINGAFTTHGIDKDPLARVKGMTAEDTMQARRKYLEQDGSDDQAVQEILDAYR